MKKIKNIKGTYISFCNIGMKPGGVKKLTDRQYDFLKKGLSKHIKSGLIKVIDTDKKNVVIPPVSPKVVVPVEPKKAEKLPVDMPLTPDPIKNTEKKV